MIVLGAGISGLVSAHYLRKRTFKPIVVLEATKRVGGWINSSTNDGTVFEAGPRTLRPVGLSGQNTLQLLEELGLKTLIVPITKTHIAAKNRMIYTEKHKISILPSSFFTALKTIPPFSQSFVAMLLNDLKAHRIKISEESIFDFAKRRFGEEFATYVIAPMMCGICAGDAKDISVNFLMQSLFENEQKYGSVIKGYIMSKINKKSNEAEQFHSNLLAKAKSEKWKIYSLEGGLESLPNCLANVLKKREVEIHLENPCINLEFHKEKVEVTSKTGTFLASNIISSLPAYQLAKTVSKQHPKLASHLLKIPYVDVVVINFQYSDPDLLRYPGFGVLIPPVEKIPVLGIIFDSCCFNLANQTLITVMMGGKWFDEFFKNMNEAQYIDVAKTNVNKILGINKNPDHIKVNVLRKCIPQYIVGHCLTIDHIQSYIRDHDLPITVCGTMANGVGINDAILSSREAINTMKILA